MPWTKEGANKEQNEAPRSTPYLGMLDPITFPIWVLSEHVKDSPKCLVLIVRRPVSLHDCWMSIVSVHVQEVKNPKGLISWVGVLLKDLNNCIRDYPL